MFAVSATSMPDRIVACSAPSRMPIGPRRRLK